MDGNSAVRSDDPRLKTVEAHLVMLQECIALANTAPESKDRWVATSLLKSAQSAYTHLHDGWRRDTSYCAWACRNLLELRIITKYALQSSSTRSRCINDIYLDFEGYLIAQRAFAAEAAKELKLEEYDEALNHLDGKKREVGFKEKKYLRLKDMADQVGMGDEFSHMNKICSKLVHATAQSILTIDWPDGQQSLRDILMLSGGKYLGELVTDMAPFVLTLISKLPEPSSA